jgi:catechol 2,3-dioxygenase
MKDTPTYKIPTDIRLGPVALTVADLQKSLVFYEEALGLQLLRSEGQQAYLGTGGSADLLVLHENNQAVRMPGRTGLYHFAILHPSRLELARTLMRLIQSGWSIEGASDHGVSEAIYLTDPDGNGIEIYRDRLPEDWPRAHGSLQMTLDPLDLNELMKEVDGRKAQIPHLAQDTTIGHIHLRVADIGASEKFYLDRLGFDLMQRYGSAASFVSAGGYHHHIGFNTWQSKGAPPPELDSAGMRFFALRLPSQAEVDTLLEHLQEHRIQFEKQDGGTMIHDPSRIAILLTV